MSRGIPSSCPAFKKARILLFVDFLRPSFALWGRLFAFGLGTWWGLWEPTENRCWGFHALPWCLRLGAVFRFGLWVCYRVLFRSCGPGFYTFIPGAFAGPRRVCWCYLGVQLNVFVPPFLFPLNLSAAAFIFVGWEPYLGAGIVVLPGILPGREQRRARWGVIRCRFPKPVVQGGGHALAGWDDTTCFLFLSLFDTFCTTKRLVVGVAQRLR